MSDQEDLTTDIDDPMAADDLSIDDPAQEPAWVEPETPPPAPDILPPEDVAVEAPPMPPVEGDTDIAPPPPGESSTDDVPPPPPPIDLSADAGDQSPVPTMGNDVVSDVASAAAPAPPMGEETSAYAADAPPMPPVEGDGTDLAPPTESTPIDEAPPMPPVDLPSDAGDQSPVPTMGNDVAATDVQALPVDDAAGDQITTPAGEVQPPLPDGVDPNAQGNVIGMPPDATTTDGTTDTTDPSTWELDGNTGMHVNADHTEWHDPTTDRHYTIDPESGHMMYVDPDTGVAEYRDQHTGEDVTEYVTGTNDGTDDGTTDGTDDGTTDGTDDGTVITTDEFRVEVPEADRDLMHSVIVDSTAPVYGMSPEETDRFAAALSEAMADGELTGREIYDAIVASGAGTPSDVDSVGSLVSGNNNVVTLIDLGDGTAPYAVNVNGAEVELTPLRGGPTLAASTSDLDDAWKSSGSKVIETITTETITTETISADDDKGSSFARNLLIGGAILLPIAGGATYLATKKLR